MKITKIECIPVILPFKKVTKGAGEEPARLGKDNVVTKVHTDEGIIGIGESGGPNVRRGETVESVMGAINNVFGPQILLGEDPFNIEKIVAKMDRVTKGNSQAKAAIDFALYDIVGKKLGVPVYKLLGGLSNEKIPLGFSLKEFAGFAGGGAPKQFAESAVRVREAGYQGIKYKVARGGVAADVENLEAIREAIGPDVRLSVDVNEGWDYYTALRALKKMKKFDLDRVEQPLPWWDIDGLARLRQSQDIPIWSDESGAELSYVLQMIRKDAVDGHQMKISCVGGLLKAQKLVSLMQTADLQVNLGAMGGSGITAAAQAHFAAATEWMARHTAHSNVSFLGLHARLETVSTPITDDLVISVPRVENGYMYPPDGPGLGVELNEELLSQLTNPSKSPTVIVKKGKSSHW